MGLEKVRDEIIERAKSQSSRIVAEAKAKAAQILREAEKQVEGHRERASEESKRMMLEIKRQEMAKAELEFKKLLLMSKKGLIDEAFEKARKEISRMNEKQRSEAVSLLIKKAERSMEIDCIYCSKSDAKFVKGYRTTEAAISGGIIAENKGQTVRIDYSFDTLMESVKEEKMQQIAKMLFG
ncbi:hypothetical protein HYU10_01840 [Candidatus Woesearchaeota archaeon]|nr:hypothetical protein [Candidatus Woesearchaeota archaeon]MBI2130487.1 hypothetical protein [Candidatus Woesearchaeota archaeon]MBI2661591.1 hypothetical protein [Candidatus Woesearchaeota archaeon]